MENKPEYTLEDIQDLVDNPESPLHEYSHKISRIDSVSPGVIHAFLREDYCEVIRYLTSESLRIFDCLDALYALLTVKFEDLPLWLGRLPHTKCPAKMIQTASYPHHSPECKGCEFIIKWRLTRGK